MGTMSASDAAPLPRLGEVFFDVRGSSRSMRLSWYADTGVSVFSIWQGGTCTGTFRLPMEELPRLIDALQRGAQANDPRGFGGYASQLPGAPTDPRLTALPGGYGREAEFTGPVTGDFRAIRAEDPAGTMVFNPSPQGAQGPRALPAGPLALPAGSGSQASQPPPAMSGPPRWSSTIVSSGCRAANSAIVGAAPSALSWARWASRYRFSACSIAASQSDLSEPKW